MLTHMCTPRTRLDQETTILNDDAVFVLEPADAHYSLVEQERLLQAPVSVLEFALKVSSLPPWHLVLRERCQVSRRNGKDDVRAASCKVQKGCLDVCLLLDGQFSAMNIKQVQEGESLCPGAKLVEDNVTTTCALCHAYWYLLSCHGSFARLTRLES